MNKQIVAFARRFRAAVFLLAAFGPLAAAQAQNRIESVTGSLQAGSEVLRVDFSEPLASAPHGFAIQSPARIALDFPGMSSGLGREAIEMNQGNLRSVNVVQAGERTRLVLNLKQATAYKTEVRGKSLLVSLQAAAGPALVAATSIEFAENRNRDVLPLRDVDFRLGTEGAGRVIVNLPNDQVGVDIRQQGRNLVVEFTKSQLPEGLNRKLDVADFGTPVQTVSLQQAGDRVRMLIEPRGDWEHSAYQSNSQFVVEVRPRKIDPAKLTQGVGYNGEKLSLNFQNIDVRALLQVIADFTNFNVVTSDTVTGTVTLRLKDVPWDQALDIIMQSKGLGVRKTGNVLWIAPKDELAAKEQVELEAKKKIADLEPLRTQAFQLNYTKAEEVAKGLTGQTGGGGGGSGGTTNTRILTPRGSVIFEARTNQLFVSDIPSKLEEIQALIAKIDIPVRQVLIEARIVEAEDSFGRTLGVKLGAVDLRGLAGGIPGYKVGGNNYVQIGSNYTNAGKQLNLVDEKLDFGQTQMVNLPANAGALGTASAATIALSLFSPTANRLLNLELSALEADGKGKIVSSPRVITSDQTKAVIEQGEEIPYQVATSSGATSIQFKKASLRLEVTPQITPEGSVIMNLDVSKDSRGELTTAGPAINTKHAQTQVLVENGGTVVLGGIFTQNERTDVNKVPLLGDIPVLGHLFRNTTRIADKTELLIFITPKIVADKLATAR